MALGFSKKKNDDNNIVEDIVTEQKSIQFPGAADVENFLAPTAVSLKTIGSYIEGLFMGIKKDETGGFTKEGLWTLSFQQEDRTVHTCVMTFQMKEFLLDFPGGFPTGEYLRIERTDTIELKTGNSMGLYAFAYNKKLKKGVLASVSEMFQLEQHIPQNDSGKIITNMDIIDNNTEIF